MKKLTRSDCITLLVLAAAILAAVLAGLCGGKAPEGTAVDSTPEKTFADYDGKKIGSVTGTTYDGAILANIRDARISYFTTYGDILAALETGKIDAFCADEPAMRFMMMNNSAVSYLPERLETYGFAFAFPKTAEGRELCDEFSDFVRRAKEAGMLQALDGKWFGTDESAQKAPDLSALTAEKGELKLAVDSENPPFVTLVGGKIAGYEVDVAYLFCKEAGYGLKIINYNFDAILPSVQSGKCQFGASSITPTAERAESVYFSEPHYDAGAVLAVRTADLGGTPGGEEQGKSIFEQVAASFEKNFIREERWKLILQGIGTTCLITLLSALFGTALAFGICMYRRTDGVLANRICDLYVKLMQGTPMVVLLLILYYVIFAKSGISAVIVAVIGFTLNFAAYAAEIMTSGIGSVGPGQREAALALGYTEHRAFFRFIFPQAATHFLPVYRGEIISLLKSTSIVGYIAIQDLTKMSDIIRSRTYEAFFPLIATAVIYFVLAWLLSLAMKQILTLTDPRKRKKGGKEAVR